MKSLVIDKKKSKKKFNPGKTASRLAQSKAMGSEPIITSSASDSQIALAFSWYNSEKSVSDAREYARKFLKKRGVSTSWVEKIPDAYFPLTSGWIARMDDIGNGLPESLTSKIELRLRQAYDSAMEAQETERKLSKPKSQFAQDKNSRKIDSFLCEMEGLLDDDRSASLYDLMKSRELPTSVSSRVIETLTPRRDEILGAISRGGDPQLKEAYSSYSREELKSMLSNLDRWIAEAKRYGEVQSIIRKARAPKPISADKIVRGVKFQPESKSLRVVSVPPVQIVGAREVWLYNTKYGSLTKIRSSSDGGLSVRGTTVIDYDESLSITKKVGRKEEYFVEQVINRTKAKLSKLMDEATTSASAASDRINENTLILRVIRD